jgi:hypothetical protein
VWIFPLREAKVGAIRRLERYIYMRDNSKVRVAVEDADEEDQTDE